MKKRKTWVAVLAILLVVMMVLGIILPALITYGETSMSDLNKQKANIEAQMKELEKNIAAKKKKCEEAEKKVAELKKEIEAQDAKIAQLEIKIGQLNGQIEEKEEELAEATESLRLATNKKEAYNDLLNERIVSMYETRTVSYWELLLTSKSLSEFFTRVEYAQQVLEYDASILSGLKSACQEIQLNKEIIEETKLSLENTRFECEEKQAAAEELRFIKKQSLVTMNRQLGAVQDELDALMVQENQLAALKANVDKQIASLKAKEAEKRRQEEERAKAELAKANVKALQDLTFMWPVYNYTTISSQWGWRIHPITGVYSKHTGCDIPAPVGTKVHAIEAGTVLKVITGYNNGYGYTVIINHGNGVQSWYCHLSGFAAGLKVGDYVSRGDVIAYVGSTGGATGPHLHLGLYLNGADQNPLLYVPKAWPIN